jgi:hypothetical protein
MMEGLLARDFFSSGPAKFLFAIPRQVGERGLEARWPLWPKPEPFASNAAAFLIGILKIAVGARFDAGAACFAVFC